MLTDAQYAYLKSQLGPEPSRQDLDVRYARLGTVRDVAVEVLRERRAALVADPLSLTINGVATVATVENVRAIERQIAELSAEPDPDHPGPTPGTPTLAIGQITRHHPTR